MSTRPVCNPSSHVQAFEQIVLGDVFHVCSATKGGFSEVLPVVFTQKFLVCIEPSLQCLRHKVDLIIGGPGRSRPPVAFPIRDVLPRIGKLTTGASLSTKSIGVCSPALVNAIRKSL